MFSSNNCFELLIRTHLKRNVICWQETYMNNDIHFQSSQDCTCTHHGHNMLEERILDISSPLKIKTQQMMNWNHRNEDIERKHCKWFRKLPCFNTSFLLCRFLITNIYEALSYVCNTQIHLHGNHDDICTDHEYTLHECHTVRKHPLNYENSRKKVKYFFNKLLSGNLFLANIFYHSLKYIVIYGYFWRKNITSWINLQRVSLTRFL